MRKSCTKLGGAKLRKGLWLPEEDEKLINYMLTHDGTAECSWGDVARNAGLQRCGRSCRLRWINYLRPDLKRGAFSPHEEELIFHLHSLHGNRWSQIAAHLPGRTDNEIKNFWYSRVKKRLKNSTSASSPNGSNSSMSMQEEGIMAMCINDPSSSSLSSSSSSKHSMAPLSHIIDPFMHDGDGYDDHGMLEHSHDNINGSLQGEFSVPSLKSVVIKANDPIIDKDNQFDNSQSCNNTDIINTNKVKIEPNDRNNWLEGDQECRLREQNLEDLTKDISSFSFYGHIPKNMLYFLYVLSQLDKSLEFPE